MRCAVCGVSLPVMKSGAKAVKEYRRMRSTNRTTFLRRLKLTTMIGAFVVMLIAMITINWMFWGGELVGRFGQIQ